MHKLRIPIVLMVLLLALGALAPAASAKKGKAKPATTKMTLTLDASEVTVGEDVTGTVTLKKRSGKTWVAVADATLTVSVDGVAVDEVTTDSAGAAAVSYTTDTEGEHVLKVAYAGDSSRKKAKRARGFDVIAAEGSVDELPEEGTAV